MFIYESLSVSVDASDESEKLDSELATLQASIIGLHHGCATGVRDQVAL